MMGGDPGLSKHLLNTGRQKFWTRFVNGAEEKVQIVCADSATQVTEKFPQLEVFEPSAEWQAEHEGKLFREYDIEINHNELMQNIPQAS
jgi:hypothetical protein